MSKKPLSGLLVIAIEQAVAAPMCTVRLADAGARVIKIERKGGETARHYDSAVDGTSAYFAWLNRGKESAVLNLKQTDDLKLFETLISNADVLIQNLAPGALARMGFTDERVSRDFPKLISVSIVGYGQDTPYANMRAYDLLVQAESGLCSVTGTPDEPSKVGVSAADIATGMNAHAAILEALIERAQTGLGQCIEISMFDSMVDWMSVPLLHVEHAAKETARFGMSHASIYPYRPFQCSDGAVLIAVQTQAEWIRFCNDVLEHADLINRKEFASNPARVANRALLDDELEPIFSAMTSDEMIKRLEAAKVAYGRYTELRNLPDHPALRRTKVTLPNGEITSMPRPAGRKEDFKTEPVPGLGVHTDSIRAEFAQSAHV